VNSLCGCSPPDHARAARKRSTQKGRQVGALEVDPAAGLPPADPGLLGVASGDGMVHTGNRVTGTLLTLGSPTLSFLPLPPPKKKGGMIPSVPYKGDFAFPWVP
jgi:hypothetical protein